eukprot:TRINITY_DN402_c0_g1_i1.p1 TRINITY_DN402_c0_g1~~TRINITY_DN402_c0_g1_i1.p1  ORF type:complete len:380 (-),score=80.40 TRINITY_DN402_c0_g1_i1:173-1222(-)
METTTLSTVNVLSEELQKRYTIQGTLGKGSFAAIFLVKHIRSGTLYALKHIVKSGVAEDNYLNECEIMRKIRDKPHPNLIKLKEIVEDAEAIYIFQEYIPNGDLLAYLKKHPFVHEKKLRSIFTRVMLALQHLHSLHIVHRDVKLENILLDESLSPRLVDYNLSCFFKNDHLIEKYCGSPLYCAPEMISKTPYRGPEVDLWSSGVLLYAMLFKKFPFHVEGGHLYKLAPLITSAAYSFPQSHSVSPEAVEIIKKLLVVDPSKRISIEKVLSEKWFDVQYQSATLMRLDSRRNTDTINNDKSEPLDDESKKEKKHRKWSISLNKSSSSKNFLTAVSKWFFDSVTFKKPED